MPALEAIVRLAHSCRTRVRDELDKNTASADPNLEQRESIVSRKDSLFPYLYAVSRNEQHATTLIRVSCLVRT